MDEREGGREGSEGRREEERGREGEKEEMVKMLEYQLHLVAH